MVRPDILASSCPPPYRVSFIIFGVCRSVADDYESGTSAVRSRFGGEAISSRGLVWRMVESTFSEQSVAIPNDRQRAGIQSLFVITDLGVRGWK